MESRNQSLHIGELLLALTFFSMIVAQGQDSDKKVKNKNIDDIIKKGSYITHEALPKAYKSQKYPAIKEVEQKLRHIPSSLRPDSESLVGIIMQGVRPSAFHGSSKPTESKMSLRYGPSSNESTDTTTNYAIGNNNTQQNTMMKLSNDIAKKIQFLANKYFNNTQTLEEKSQILEKNKLKLLDSLTKNDILSEMKSAKEPYFDLIMKGLSQAAYKTPSNDSRRMKIKFVDSFVNNTNDEIYVNLLDDYSDVDEYITRIDKAINANQSYCEIVVKDLCADIKSLDVLKCMQDNSEVSIVKLCNGINDCPDTTDEWNCKAKVISRLHSARNTLKKLDTPKISSCFSTFNSPTFLITNQQEILRQLLKRQIRFVKKYTNFTFSSSPFYDNNANVDENTFRKTMNEVTEVLQTFSSALNGLVCLKEELTDIKQRSQLSPELFVDDLDEEINQVPKWSPKFCKCNEQHCADENCDNNCKRVCWQMYSLGQWSCQAVNGLTAVPIDVICDGKLDCFDESDEADCSKGGSLYKFDAISTYENILEQIEERTHKYSIDVSTRNALLALHRAVKKLQHIGTKNNPDSTQVKVIRDQCFTGLKAVYEEIRLHASFIEEVEDANLFLSYVNKMLVKALKSTHSGNDRLISPDGCYCTGTKCALPVCTRRCTRACSAETVLTKYPCGGIDNVSIPVEYICNGKDNCPGGDDEHCKKNEICRAHHLVVLRHKIKDVDAKQKGVLGEMVKAWKTKATARLKIAESQGRPSPRFMKDIIHDLLQDLLMTYGSIDEYRRSIALNNDVILDKFIDISRTVMDSLKTCGK